MTRIKVLGLALVAVFAMSALAVSSASAASPSWLECKKEAGGKYEKGCGAEGGKGGYSIVVGVGKGKEFKSSGATAVLHSVNPEAGVDIPVTCTSFKGKGLAVAPNLVAKVNTTFKGCKALGAPCSNGKKETISTKQLAGSLGWINKAANVSGTDLADEATPGSYLAEFTCEALGEIRTGGSVIGVNGGQSGKFSKTSTLTFAPGKYLGSVEWAPGKFYEPIVNIPEFEGGSPDILKTEVKGAITGHPTEFYPPGGIPSGQEGVSNQKGENLEIG